MNLDSLDPRKKANEGTFMQLRHPVSFEPMFERIDDVLSPVGLWLKGSDSADYQAAKVRMAQRRQDAAKMDDKEKAAFAVTLLNDVLAAVTTGWQEITFDGMSEHTPENSARLYASLSWVRDQADHWVHDRGNFI